MLKLFYFRWNLVISDLAVEDKNSCYFCFRRTLEVFIRVFWALSYLFTQYCWFYLSGHFYRATYTLPWLHSPMKTSTGSERYLTAIFFFYHVSCFWRCCCCTTSAADLREFFLPSGLFTLHSFPTFRACTN